MVKFASVNVKALLVSSTDGTRRTTPQGGDDVVGRGEVDGGTVVVSGGAVTGSVVTDGVVSGGVENGAVVGTGQAPKLHGSVSFLGPTQSEPLLIGGGLVQLRYLTWIPGPQEEVHGPKATHSVKPPSTATCTPNASLMFWIADSTILVNTALFRGTVMPPEDSKRT